MKVPTVALDVSGSAPIGEYIRYLLNRDAEPDFRLVLFAEKVLTDGFVHNRKELQERVRHRYLGGGTDINRLFEYLETGEMTKAHSIVYPVEVELLIVYTDGMCPYPPKAPPYPIYWAPFLEPGWEPPFGEMLP